MLSYLPHENVSNQGQAITHSLAFLLKTSKPVQYTRDIQTGATNTPGLLQFWGLVHFITATLSSVQIRNPGRVNLMENGNVGGLEERVVFFVVSPEMALWYAEKARACGWGTWGSGWWGTTTKSWYWNKPSWTKEKECDNGE